MKRRLRNLSREPFMTIHNICVSVFPHVPPSPFSFIYLLFWGGFVWSSLPILSPPSQVKATPHFLWGPTTHATLTCTCCLNARLAVFFWLGWDDWLRTLIYLHPTVDIVPWIWTLRSSDNLERYCPICWWKPEKPGNLTTSFCRIRYPKFPLLFHL